MTLPQGGARPAPAQYRRYWLPDLLVLLALAIGSTTVFFVAPLDLSLGALFFDNTNEAAPFPGESYPLWQLFYWCAPVIAALLAGGGFAAIVWGSFQPGRGIVAVYGLFLVLSVVLGPGLVVNGILKDNWGRPRPRQIVEFGGEATHRPPLVITPSEDGKSFPCGHCSIGFVTSAFYFLLRRRRPGLAYIALGGSILLGLLMGWGRMAAGAHFFSDVLWAGYSTFAVNALLYYFILNVPGREDSMRTASQTSRSRAPAIFGYCLLGALLLSGVLLATPVSKELAYRVTTAEMAKGPETLDLVFSKADVTLELTGPGTLPFDATGTVRGFGLPLQILNERGEHEGNTIHYRFEHEGIFTELEPRVHVRVNATRLREVTLRVAEGDVRVIVPEPLTHRPILGIQAGKGTVHLPEPSAFGN